jgi:hypothetical protein
MYSGIKARLKAIELRLKRRLSALPLKTSRPRMTPRGVASMAERAAVYSPAELRAADDRALAYDAVWGFCGDSTLAGFMDLERIRTGDSP